MKRIFTLITVALIATVTAFGWGREGHETIAKIADNNLQPSAKKKIEKYLGNHSIVYFAKWMDEYRRTPEYEFTGRWHTVGVTKDFKHRPSKGGDAVTAINDAVALLKDYKNLSDSTVCVNLKYLIHLVGDMHCPAHISYEGRQQGFNVVFGDNHYLKPIKTVNFHSVWDYVVIHSSRIWSVGDYAYELDRLSKKEIRQIVAGTPEEWLTDNAKRCEVQFEMAGPDDHVAQDFVNEALPLIETQMQYAGYRLAALLNDLF